MSKRILLADDSVTIQKVVELTFMDEDYEVVAVSNGDDAVQRLGELQPDLVIADVHMRHRDHGLAAQHHQIAQDAEHLGGGERIQAAGRLVRKDDRRIVGERAGHGDPLPLSAGQLIGSLVAMVAEAERCQQFLRA